MPRYDRDTSVETSVTLSGDADGAVQVTETVTRTWAFEDLFSEVDDEIADQRMVLIRDPGFGWNGFEIRDGDFFIVNYQQLDSDGGGRYLQEERVDRETVEQKVLDAVEDPMLGDGKGDFKLPMRPP